jgi:hypothetical protein
MVALGVVRRRDLIADRRLTIEVVRDAARVHIADAVLLVRGDVVLFLRRYGGGGDLIV